MWNHVLKLTKKASVSIFVGAGLPRCYYTIPFVEFYQRTMGQQLSEYAFYKLKKNHPTIDMLSHDRLQCTVQILSKFDISAEDACQDPHVFTMNPITMDNYGEILRECGFVKIVAKNIIRYHTIVRNRTIAQLKREHLIQEDINLEEILLDYFKEWPADKKSLMVFPDSKTSILKVRLSVLERYLNWKLLVTTDEFNKYIRNYLPLKHKPMTDIQEALDIAQNDIKFDTNSIRRNGFIISADPVNTKLILENVKSLAGFDIRCAIRTEPAILKNNYNSLMKIRNILEEYRISEEAQRRCLRVYCMCPSTVEERLNELRNLKEYQVLKTNPRVLSMIVHKRKMLTRLEKIQAAKKQCFSLNHLVSSSKVFNNYISSFGNKVCGRDIAILISSSLQVGAHTDSKSIKNTSTLVLQQLKRHKYWLHAALGVIDENIRFLKSKFADEVIFNNCQLLLYPVLELEQLTDYFIKMRTGINRNISGHVKLDASYNNLNYNSLNDHQILSLVLYEIEKKYHFSGDGIWSKLDGLKAKSQGS